MSVKLHDLETKFGTAAVMVDSDGNLSVWFGLEDSGDVKPLIVAGKEVYGRMPFTLTIMGNYIPKSHVKDAGFHDGRLAHIPHSVERLVWFEVWEKLNVWTATVEGKLAIIQGSIDSLEKQIATLDDERAELTGRRNEIDQSISALYSTLSDKWDELDSARWAAQELHSTSPGNVV